MDETKAHKKKVLAEEVKRGEAVTIDELPEKKITPARYHPRHRAADDESQAPKKNGPNIGQRMQYATYAAVSTTERLINGLSNIYTSIFVGNQDRRLDFDKERGIKCFEAKDYKNALRYFNLYLDNGNDSDSDVLFLLAMSHVSLEEYEKAVEYLKKARKLDSANAEIAVELAHCLINVEDYPEAITCFKQSIEMAPDEPDHYYNLGGCYEKIEQVEEAKQMYKKAIDLAPREAAYYQALGFVYENSGNHKDAIVCFKKAMDLDRKQRTTRGGGRKKT